MAYNYQYSKPFSQNGAPVAPVNLRTDLIGVSVPTTVSATAPWGHISKDKTLEAFQKYFFAEVKLEGIGVYDIFKVGGGIIGKGTAADPIVLDREWLDDRYMPSFNFPISQVGDPSDFLLPISGSYFSVTFPIGNQPYHATAFVEGNGDMRILHHVTNGEELRPVYALWKDYKNTPPTTMQITDVVYRPPGLDVNEFIHNVHPASESTMVASVFRPEGFQEHVLIMLNGTMSANYHQIIRLGHQIFTELYQVPFSYLNLRKLDSTSIASIVGADGKIYIAVMPFPANPINGAVSSMMLGRVDLDASGNATIVAITNTQTTNHNGGVNNNAGSGFIMHQKISTTDRSADKDALYLTTPQLTWRAGVGNNNGADTGVSPSQSMNIAGLTPDGKIVVTFRYYHWCSYGSSITRNLKPVFYYLLDPVARTLTAIEDSKGNKEWGVLLAENNTTVTVLYGGIRYYDGHYTAGGSIFQLLPDGTRVVHVTPGSGDVTHTIITYTSADATTAMEGAHDSLFEAKTITKQHSLNPVPPTPIQANRGSWLMFNNLMVSDAPQNGSFDGRRIVKAKLIGSSTDKQYRILSTDAGAPPAMRNGYNLNNDRVVIPGVLRVPVSVTVLNNTPRYHSGYWCQGVTEISHVAKYDLDELQESSKNYILKQSVIDKMDALKPNIIAPSPEYSKVYGFSWAILGPHPGVGASRCLVRYIISWMDDSGTPIKYTGIHQGLALAPCTIDIDSTGTATITDVDLSGLSMNPINILPSHYVINAGVGNLGYGGGVLRIMPDGNYHFLWTSCGNSGTLGGTGFEVRACRYVIFKPDGTLVSDAPAVSVGANGVRNWIMVNRPTWHAVHGLGYVNVNEALGALYSFVPIDDEGVVDNTKEQIILGSARPAAGFSMTVSADIPVYVTGSLKYIRQQILDLRDTKADPKWSIFYISAEVSASEDAELVITLDPPVDTENRIYLGKIVTNETEITEMVLEPVTRWEGKRVSTEALGSSIIVSTGFPGGPGEITAISAGIDPTRFQGTVNFDAAAKTVSIVNSGSFYIQDKDLAIARFGDFEQTYISVGVDKGRCWINGVEVWKGKGQSSDVVNRNALLRSGWNTVSLNAGQLTIRGPFLKR